jgi:Asp-tRNA(Asn)/Glu-tRNA(Gln) amidotransferase A subunit family amidase
MTAFIEPLRVGPATLAKGAPDGPLTGVTFAVKDIVDVAGWATRTGWRRTSQPNATPRRCNCCSTPARP